jgi:epsilon-lactone hydrolase
VVLAGDSAGGNLVLTALLRLRDEGAALPAGVIAISPWVDLAREGGSLVANQDMDWGIAAAFTKWARVYLSEGDLQDPLVSPLFGDFAGAPPILLLSGECEMLRDQLDDFAARTRASGADLRDERYTDMVHGWMTLSSLTPEGPRAFERCGAFVRELEARSTAD